MSMWHICMFELRRILKIRSVVLNLFILPLLLIFILGTALSSAMGTGEGNIPDVSWVGVIQPSDMSSPMGEAFKVFATTPEVSRMMKVQNMPSKDEAVNALKQGKLDFAVIMTSDMMRQWMAGKEVKAQWILGKDSTLNIVGQTLFTRFTDELNRQAAIAEVLGPEMIPAASAQTAAESEEQSSIRVSVLGTFRSILQRFTILCGGDAGDVYAVFRHDDNK